MMRLVTDDTELTPLVAEAAPSETPESEWSAEVDMILSAMDAAGSHPQGDRRAAQRRTRRAKADLRLYAQNPLDPPIALFTRDVSATGIGFITKERLPLGYNGLIRISLDGGDNFTAACSVYRCREAIGGWYEGALHFTRRQPDMG
ncbi:MAG: hypothetical protein JWM57_4230 [Phycisphaerales bacterium]|nr:hypothetical protein [Phycisphaerales bacterium]